jgi:hypothetical protein
MPAPTDDEILAMPAGPEMDRLVFETIMSRPLRPEETAIGYDDRPRPYSTEERSAQRVGLRLARSLGMIFSHRFPRAFPVSIAFRLPDGRSVSASGETIPLAICRAALLAVRLAQAQDREKPIEW